MTREQLVTIVGTIFMVQHNIQKPDADAEELLSRSFKTADRTVTSFEAMYAAIHPVEPYTATDVLRDRENNR